jgi:hypothetical protein
MEGLVMLIQPPIPPGNNKQKEINYNKNVLIIVQITQCTQQLTKKSHIKY